MIKVNEFILNEKLIKVATPYFKVRTEGVVTGFPRPMTKITFIDNTEMVFEGMDMSCLFNELQNLKK